MHINNMIKPWLILFMAVLSLVLATFVTAIAYIAIIALAFLSYGLANKLLASNLSSKVESECTASLLEVVNAADDKILGHIQNETNLINKELGNCRNILREAIEGLSNSFSRLIDQSNQQKELVNTLFSSIDNVDKVNTEVSLEEIKGVNKSINRSVEITLESLGTLSVEFKENINKAIVSLQFEDMLYQLTEQIELKTNGMEEAIGMVIAGYSELRVSETLNDAQKLMALKELSDKIKRQIDAHCKKTVTQKTLDTGSIDLF